jgi:ribonucleoside-diphosphate reductase alpha chain
MRVTKRNGELETIEFDKILKRIRSTGQEAGISINYTALVMKVIDQLFDTISTTKIDELTAEQCASMSSIHPDYNVLAGRIIVSNHHKNTESSFSDAMCALYHYLDKHGKSSPLINKELYDIAIANAPLLDGWCDFSRDYLIDYFGFKTLERAYLMKINGKIVERPQHMWLRVALGIHGTNFVKAKETYDLMSQKYFTHATPTLFNAGTPHPQLSSCFEKNTLVHTLRGPIPIKDVQIGDEVITHLGNVKKVVQVHKNEINGRKLYEVSINKTKKFIATEDHKLFVYDKKIKKTQWKEINQLSNCDYIMIPNYNGSIQYTEINVLNVIEEFNFNDNKNQISVEFTEDKKQIYLRTHWTNNHLNNGQEINVSKKSTPINITIPIDNNMMKFFGIWFGDGHIMSSKGYKKDNNIIRGIGFTIHKDNEELINFCIEMKTYFGIDNVTIHNMQNQNVIQVLYNCPTIGILFYQLFGKGFAGKHLHSDFYKYDTTLILSFLSGLVTTDGCISKEHNISLCMSNKILTEEIYTLCRLHNLDVGKPNPVKFGKLTRNQAYNMSLTNLKQDLTDIWKTYSDDRLTSLCDKPYNSSHIIKDNGFTFIRFNKREEVNIDDEFVYTLGVEDDHSYSIEGIIAQNCFLLSMESDSIDGIYNTLKDCANISKWAGGIGLHIHNIRASGSHIRGTNGSSNGIVPMLRVFNHTAKYVDQCLDPETVVYTKRGAIPIKNIVIGDEVITDDGQFYEIGKVLDSEYTGDFYEMDVQHTFRPLSLTDMHPLWCIKNVEGSDCYHMRNLLAKKLIEPEFIEAKNIDTNDYIGFPIPKYEKDIREYSEDDCRFYGIYITSITNKQFYDFSDIDKNKMMIIGDITTMSDTPFYIQLPRSKTNIILFIENYLNKYNIPFDISISTGDIPHRASFRKCSDVLNPCGDRLGPITNDLIKISWHRTNRFKFTYEMFYEGVPALLHLPQQKMIQLIRGIFEVSGITMDGNYFFVNCSKGIIENLHYMLLRLGVLTSGNVNVLKIHVNDFNKILGIDVFVHDSYYGYFEYNDYLFSCVKNNTLTKNYSGRVIDIEVDHDDHHNFLTHNGLVKNGGGKRNGSFAIYLEPWHADIEIFLQMRKNHGDEELKARDLFYALWIPDLFMERVKTNGSWTLMCPDECPGLSDVYGDAFKELYEKYEASGKGRVTLKARDLWFQVLDAQMETGTPYLLYKDAVNKKSNQKNVGTIKSSNLCVAPETQVLTDKGHIEIQFLEGNKVNVWNGSEFSEVEIFKTGTDQKIIEVHTSDNCVLNCTPYHKFFIQQKYNKAKFDVIEAQNLKLGDKLIKCDYPVIEGTSKMNYAYTHGFFCGDGTYFNNNSDNPPTRCQYKCLSEHYYCKRHINYETENNKDSLQNNELIDKVQCNALSYEKKPAIFLYADKKLLVEHIQCIGKTEDKTKIILRLPLDIEEKYFVPMNHDMETKMNWFAGYCDADGCITNNQGNQQLQVTSINEPFLMNVKLMLQTCGINPKIRKMYDKGTSYLPDGRGGHRDFVTKPLFRMLITSVDLQKIVCVGFEPKRLQINNIHVPNRSASKYVTITDVIDNGRIDDTFCFTEPKKHAGIFNGIITSQCTEITEYSDENESAVCNLASIGLPTFLDYSTTPPTFNYEKLHDVTKVVTENLNRIIDRNYYPTEKTRRSNMRHRPIGIGIQGLADTFILMDLAFTSDEAKVVNRHIFETIYHGALEQSCELAVSEGAYETFPGSPASEGILQFDMWGYDPGNERYDWTAMKSRVKEHGIRNSLLLAPMPTASTSQILGFNECFEPITSNIYSRRTIAGEFVVTNKYLVSDLLDLGLWNEVIKTSVIANNGSIQQINIIPEKIREKYRTAWEIPMKTVIDMAAERGVFICQSQSMNTWIEEPSYNSLTSMHFYSWGKGLKTGIYYLRRRAAHQAQQFTIEPEKRDRGGSEMDEDHEICEMCSG